MKKVLDILTLISSVFVCFCYGIYLMVSIIQSNTYHVILLAAAVITLALIPVIFGKKMPSWLKILFCAGMCFYMVTFSIFSVSIYSFHDDSTETLARDSDVIVLVYGCRTYAHGPSKSLAYRLNAAYDLLVEFPDSLCIVSGGQGDNEPVTEAESMKVYLVDKGIDENRIIKEERSTSTVENIEFSKEIIEKLNLTDYQVISVSSDFHMQRIKILSDNMDFETMLSPAKSGDIFTSFANLVREYMSYVKMIILHL